MSDAPDEPQMATDTAPRRSAAARAKRWFLPIFFVLVVVFFALYLRDVDWSSLSELSFSWPMLIVATLISLAFRFWGVLIWRFILKDLGAPSLPAFVILSDTYAKAWMGRYIPGTVTWIAGKVFMAGRLGISKSKLAVSSLLEAGMQVVASMFVALLILGLDPRLDVISSTVKTVMVVLAVGSLLILLPPIFNRLVGFGFALLKKREALAESRSNARATIRSFVLYAIGTVIAGSSYVFLVQAIYPQLSTTGYFWYIVGAFTLAGALGMATPFVPSGLGVRDGVQLVLLSVIMPKDVALAITVFSRLWSALVDVLFFVVARLAMAVYQRFGGSAAVAPTSAATSERAAD